MNLSVQVKIFCFFKGDFIKNNFEIKISDKITFKEFIAQLRKNKKITPDFEKEINKNESPLMILVNGKRVETNNNEFLQDGDTISVLSPLAGG